MIDIDKVKEVVELRLAADEVNIPVHPEYPDDPSDEQKAAAQKVAAKKIHAANKAWMDAEAELSNDEWLLFTQLVTKAHQAKMERK